MKTLLIATAGLVAACAGGAGESTTNDTRELREQCGYEYRDTHEREKQMCLAIATNACELIHGGDALNNRLLLNCLSYNGNWRLYLDETSIEDRHARGVARGILIRERLKAGPEQVDIVLDAREAGEPFPWDQLPDAP